MRDVMESSQSELACSRIMSAHGTPRDTKINGNRLDSTHRALAHQLLSGSQGSQHYSNHCHNISLNMGNDTKQSCSYYIVTIEGECETVHDLLNGTSFNDLE